MFEPLALETGLSLPQVLAQKAGSEETAMMTMKNYLLNVLQLEERTNKHMLELFQDLVIRFSQVIQEQTTDPQTA
jgi:hypothetical protein